MKIQQKYEMKLLNMYHRCLIEKKGLFDLFLTFIQNSNGLGILFN